MPNHNLKLFSVLRRCLEKRCYTFLASQTKPAGPNRTLERVRTLFETSGPEPGGLGQQVF
ncbi:hypothetical protein BKI51_06430 [Alphaproteobacteria bacterium AO1-B]|nr:hypothetical protein BKI51_06430 [Alphaproteobacteria bacterium AO1-B]